MATIKNILRTIFQSEGSDRSIRELNNLGRAQTRLGQSSASAGRAFSAQASGLGGLVAAYAGAAATTFALQQAFSKLADAARATQTLDGLTSLAASSGANASKILQSVQEATKGQLTIIQAAQQANLSLSAGFNSDQIERLAGVATKASRALGRDLTDAYTRVVRGSAKMETELLDELGIYTKIDPATRAYAAAIGKTVSQLSEYERRQAFVNSVIEEGERKFRSINTTIPTSAEKIEAFGATVVNLATKFGILLADIIAPLADFLANNLVASISVVGLAFSLVAAKGASLLTAALSGLVVKTTEIAVSSENVARKMLGMRNTVIAANSAIQTINVSNLRLNETQKDELAALQKSATTRALSSAEMKKAIALVNINTAAITTETATAQNSLATSNAKVASLRAEMQAKQAAYNMDRTNTVALQEARSARGAYGAAVRANNAVVATNTPIIAANTAALNANAAASAAATAATAGTLARVAGGVSAVIKGVGALFAGISALVLGFVSFASIAVIVIGFFALITLGIAKLLGKERELTAFITTVFGNLKEFVFGLSDKDTRNVFLGIATDTLEKLEAVDSRLKNLDEFTFKKKILGITVPITLTKQDLIRDVEKEIADVANLNVFEAFTMTGYTEALASDGTWANLGASIGGAIGVGITAASIYASAGIGIVWGAALTTAFVGVGAKVGAAFDKSFLSESEAIAKQLEGVDTSNISAKYAKELSGLSAEQQNYALLVISNLRKSNEGVERFNAEAMLALEVQEKLTIESIRQQKTVEFIAKAMAATGKQVSELASQFTIAYNEADNVGEIISELADVGTIKITILPELAQQNLSNILNSFDDVQSRINDIRPPGWWDLTAQVFGSVETNLLGDFFNTQDTSKAPAIEKLINLVLTDGKSVVDIIDQFSASSDSIENRFANVLRYTKLTTEELRFLLTGVNQDIGTYITQIVGYDSTLGDALTRGTSNLKDLEGAISSGTISAEQFDQSISAAQASLAEAEAINRAYNSTLADLANEGAAVEDVVNSLTQAQIDNIAASQDAIDKIKEQLLIYEAQKQGILDLIGILDFLKKTTDKALTSLEFEVALAEASGNQNAGLLRQTELAVGFATASRFAADEMQGLSNILNDIPTDSLNVDLRAEILNTSIEDIDKLAGKYSNLSVITTNLGKSLQIDLAKGGFEIVNLRTAEGIKLFPQYEKALENIFSLGQKLKLAAVAESVVLSSLTEELDRRIALARAELAIENRKKEIAEEQLRIATDIANIEFGIENSERGLKLANSAFETNNMLAEAQIKQNNAQISALETQQKLNESIAKMELASLEERQAEAANLLAISNKVLDTRLEYLKAATDLSLLDSNLVAGGPENIATYLESVYEKQRQLTDTQVQLFRNQLTNINQEYQNRVDLLNFEKTQKAEELASEKKILELQKDIAKTELDRAEAALFNLFTNNLVEQRILKDRQSIEKEKIASDLKILGLEKDNIAAKLAADKTASDLALNLETDKNLATADALLEQYKLLRQQYLVYNNFLDKYKDLLNEARRQEDPNLAPLDFNQAAFDFEFPEEQLTAFASRIRDQYEVLKTESRNALDAQSSAASSSIAIEEDSLNKKQELNNRYFEAELIALERRQAAALELQRAEIASREAAFQNLVDELKIKTNEITTLQTESATGSEEAFTAYITNVIELYGQLQNAVASLTSSIASQNASLASLSLSISASNASIEARRVELGFTRQINDIQGDIAVRQSEINLLKAQEAESAGSGISAQQRLLTLKQQEINFQAELNNLQAESTKRRLEASIESAQSSLSLFEDDVSVSGLAGSITALSSVFVQQQELVELQRSQAEEAYRRELELVEIDRALLEEDKKAKGGAAAASAAVLQAEKAQLLDQQNIARLELDNSIAAQANAVKNIEAERLSQENQAKIDGARASAQAAANRAELEAIVQQADVFSAFIKGIKTEIPAVFNKVLEAMGKEPIDLSLMPFADIDIGANVDLSKARADLDTVDADIERLYGVAGEVFKNINANADTSLEAANQELAALEKRKTQLASIQANELAAFDSRARASAAGSAMELAEIDKREKELKLRIANATDKYAQDMEEASKAAADSARDFIKAVVDTFGKFIVAQKQAKVNTLLEEEAQLKDVLAFQTEALNEAQSAASNALQEEISLREQLKDATESLIQSQTSYLDSIGSSDGANVTEASKQFIDTLLDQKQAIFDLQRATRGRIAADSRLSSLEGIQAELTDALRLKTAQRIEAEENLEKTQEKLAMITKLVSGEIGNFIKSLGSLGNSLAGLSGGGSFGQVFSNLLGFQDTLESFANVGTTFAAAAGKQLAAANTQQQAAATLDNAATNLTGTSPTNGGAIVPVVGGGGVATGTAGAASGLTFSGLASTAFAGAGIGSLVGALTGDTSWASTIGGAVGSTLATVFAGSTFVGAVSAGIATLATSAGFAAAGAASIALIATPLIFAVIGALIFGALFGKKKPKPQALISGTVTEEGFDTTSVSSRDLSSSNIDALESIPQQVFSGFLSNFEAAGLQFRDSADVTIDFYKGEFRKIQTTFSSGLSTTASNIGKSAQDAADELERQFYRGLGADSFEVDQFTPSRERIQQALKTFGEIDDLDQKTRERFIEGLTYAQEFDNIVRSFLGTSVDINNIFNTINSAARSFTENKLNEYLSELNRASEFFGASSNELKTLQSAIRSNALSLVGLAEASDGSLVSSRELASSLNAGAIAIRNIVAETSALRSTFVGLGNVLSGIDIDAAIGQALSTRLREFVSDFGDSLNLAIDILRDPAKIVLVDLEKFIVNGTERIRQSVGVYNQIITEQASGVLISSDIIISSYSNIEKSTELLNLELKGFISTISDKGQLQAIIDGAEAIDDYAGAIARSAAEARLAEINEIERTQATQQFNKISREFTKRLREITGAASGLTIGGEGVSFIDILEAFGTSNIDQAARDFKTYLDLINSGSNISSNFSSAIDFLNTRFDNGETDSLKFVSALELLQRVTLETIDSIEQLTEAYESTLQQINEAFNSSRTALVDSVRNLGDELVSLIKAVSDQTQEILSIYDDAVSSVAETGSAIFDLRDAAKDAFTSAADAVAEFEKANKLSGRSSAQVRAELESVSAQIADSLGAQSFDLDSFILLSGLTSQQSSLQRELKRLGTVESEYETLLKTRTEASEGLAFVEENISKLSGTLTDARSTESKIIQDTRKAVEDYTVAQATLSEVTATLSENNFDLTQTRIDETSAVLKLNEALRGLNRDTIKLDEIIADILTTADSTLRDAFIQGAIGNLAGELATLDETVRAARIAEVTLVASSAFDALVPLAASIANLGDSETVNTMEAVSEATNLTTDTFTSLLGIFNADTLNPVETLINEINRYSAITAEIENVSAFSAGLLNLGTQSATTGADVALLVSDLNALETQLTSLTSDTGVESLREVFKGLAMDLQKSWDENVILGLPDVINLSAISVADDGGLNELKTIATNSNKFAYIKAVGAQGMDQAIFRAEGGYVSGPGTSTSDSIPAQLSNGEYVIKASTVKKIGLGMLNDLNASGDLDSVIAAQGRFGDSAGAHINQEEIALLKKYGGSGTRNPATGMLEFFGGASSGANAYGGLFAAEEAAYVEKIQKSLPNGNPSMQNSTKANIIDTRKLNNTFFNSVGNPPVDLLNRGGNDIMGTDSYNAMQNQMLSSTMIMDTLASKRGMPGVESQTQGFGMDSYKSPKKKSFFGALLGAIVGGLLAIATGGASLLLTAGLIAGGAAVGALIDNKSAAKAGEMQNKDIEAVLAGVSAKDLGRGGYDVKNSSANKVLLNGNTILTDQSDLSKRYPNVLNNVLGNKAKKGDPAALVDAYNKKNDKFFDFYMLNNPSVPAYKKATYTAKNSSTGGLIKSLNAASSLPMNSISGKRDSIPAMLEPGEFVLRKAAVDRMGIDRAVQLNSTGNVENDVSVEVNVINNSSPVTPTIQQTRRENGKIIVDVILEDIRNNGPIRQSIRGVK